MRRLGIGGGLVFAAALASLLTACAPDRQAQIARGRYLVQIIACGDCHSPGGFTPKPDPKLAFSGSDTEFNVPGEGVFVPPNLTPDRATGIGAWTEEQIATAITTGKRPDGRILASCMPWNDFSRLTHPDALAIAAYLKTLPAVSNKVPGPSAEKPAPTGTVETITVRSKS